MKVVALFICYDSPKLVRVCENENGYFVFEELTFEEMSYDSEGIADQSPTTFWVQTHRSGLFADADEAVNSAKLEIPWLRVQHTSANAS